MKEAILEPILRKIRIEKVLPAVRQCPDCRLLDIGCGRDYQFLKTIEPFVGFGVGIDFKVPETKTEKIETLQMMMSGSLPFESGSFDIVTMLAVLEHLVDPVGMIAEVERVLRKGGRLIMTVPGTMAKPVLRFLAFRLHMVNEVEMKGHRRYFNRTDLYHLVMNSGMIMEQHRYFELGMNNFCVARKAIQDE